MAEHYTWTQHRFGVRECIWWANSWIARRATSHPSFLLFRGAVCEDGRECCLLEGLRLLHNQPFKCLGLFWAVDLFSSPNTFTWCLFVHVKRSLATARFVDIGLFERRRFQHKLVIALNIQYLFERWIVGANRRFAMPGPAYKNKCLINWKSSRGYRYYIWLPSASVCT